MAAGVLAQPVFEEYATNVAVQFDEREYKKWLGTYRDLPEEIVSQLALNRERNQFIASTYSNPTQVVERSRAFRRPYPAKASTPRNNSNRIAICQVQNPLRQNADLC